MLLYHVEYHKHVGMAGAGGLGPRVAAAAAPAAAGKAICTPAMHCVVVAGVLRLGLGGNRNLPAGAGGRRGSGRRNKGLGNWRPGMETGPNLGPVPAPLQRHPPTVACPHQLLYCTAPQRALYRTLYRASSRAAGYIVFMTPTMMAGVLSDERVAAHIASGYVTMLLWEGQPTYQAPGLNNRQVRGAQHTVPQRASLLYCLLRPCCVHGRHWGPQAPGLDREGQGSGLRPAAAALPCPAPAPPDVGCTKRHGEGGDMGTPWGVWSCPPPLCPCRRLPLPLPLPPTAAGPPAGPLACPAAHCHLPLPPRRCCRRRRRVLLHTAVCCRVLPPPAV